METSIPLKETTMCGEKTQIDENLNMKTTKSWVDKMQCVFGYVRKMGFRRYFLE